MKNRQKRDQDREKLKELFYLSFDRSRAENLLNKHGNEGWTKQPSINLLGEGTHFRVFLMRSIHKDTIDLVLKCAKPEFLEGRGPKFLEQWAARLKTASKSDLELIPPMELIKSDDYVGLVMPYGEDGLGDGAKHWQPVEKLLDKLQVDMNKLGLEIGDWIQGVSRKGTPFVHDLSDLEDLS